MTAERKALFLIQPADFQLQRGRGLVTAESLVWQVFRSFSHLCFNGAAVVRLRKDQQAKDRLTAAAGILAVALVGMGVTSLSMATAAVRAVGAQLSAVDSATCRAAADAAVAAADPMAGRDAVRALLSP